jgi:hypothetical protein
VPTTSGFANKRQIRRCLATSAERLWGATGLHKPAVDAKAVLSQAIDEDTPFLPAGKNTVYPPSIPARFVPNTGVEKKLHVKIT